MRVYPAVLAGLLGLTLVGGCTTMTEGQATPGSTASSAPSPTGPGEEELPSHGAPKVVNALDVGRFEQDACLALTAEQAQELVLKYPGEPWNSSFGDACLWITPKGNGSVSIGFFSELSRGLSAVYEEHEKGQYDFFEPQDEIEGFPAVVYGVQDRRSDGICDVSVGVSDKLTFVTTVTLSMNNVGNKDACQESVKVAGMMLRTMKDS